MPTSMRVAAQKQMRANAYARTEPGEIRRRRYDKIASTLEPIGSTSVWGMAHTFQVAEQLKLIFRRLEAFFRPPAPSLGGPARMGRALTRPMSWSTHEAWRRSLQARMASEGKCHPRASQRRQGSFDRT